MAQIKRVGYCQVEPNHLSGIVEGKIYAQLPAAAAMGDVLENGRFAKYDYVKGEVNLTGEGPWMMIYNEEKLYDERKQSHKDYAMTKETFVGGVMVPRLFIIEIGDIFTTNAITANADGEDLAVGDHVGVGADGYLAKADDGEFAVVKVYTMADGQPAVKLQKVK